jgi:hypothetical protein
MSEKSAAISSASFFGACAIKLRSLCPRSSAWGRAAAAGETVYVGARAPTIFFELEHDSMRHALRTPLENWTGEVTKMDVMWWTDFGGARCGSASSSARCARRSYACAISCITRLLFWSFRRCAIVRASSARWCPIHLLESGCRAASGGLEPKGKSFAFRCAPASPP